MSDSVPPDLPGAELVGPGVSDLRAGRRTANAALVAMATQRLRAVGVPVPDHDIADPTRELYFQLAPLDGSAAHARYNALLGRLVSFCEAAEAWRRLKRGSSGTEAGGD